MSASDPSYPAYPVAALSACILVLVPLPWHLQAWNSGTCLYMVWTAVSCLNLGINSILWHGTAIDRAPVWCDISSRIIVAANVAIPMASLCINRRLYKIATLSSVNKPSSAQKRRVILIDLALGIGVPLLQVVMQYIVSGHRYDIYGDVGCYPFTYDTPLAYPLSAIWPVVIGLISAVYCSLTLRSFLKQRAQFNQFLSCNASLNASRYFRLMALATVELCCMTPMALYGLCLNIESAKVQPWISWADTHWHYSKVDQYPALLWRMDRNGAIAIEITRWAPVVCALTFFTFFGFASEARRHYRDAFGAVRCLLVRCVLHTRTAASKTSHDNVLPIYNTPRQHSARFVMEEQVATTTNTLSEESFSSMDTAVIKLTESG